jgi:hypothetical protein
MSTNRQVVVNIPHGNMDIKHVQVLVANLMKQVGHLGCFSGFDINFRQEVEFTANLAGEVKGVGEIRVG